MFFFFFFWIIDFNFQPRIKGTMMEKLNSEQQKAVTNIIGKVDKLPYILFGPPGESIKTILESFDFLFIFSFVLYLFH